MKNDEYNHVEVKNEQQLAKFEFGNIQRNEFTSFRENKTTINRDEQNPSFNSNNENNRPGDKKTNNDDFTEVKTSQTKASSQIVQNAVQSAAKSATISQAVSTVSVGAVVVAVTSVSAITGINVISKNLAQCYLRDLAIATNEVSYLVELQDSEDDPFELIIENNTFKASKPLEEGLNEGTIEGLDENTSYRMYVQEMNINKKIIFDTRFTTNLSDIEEPEPEPGPINGKVNALFAGTDIDYRTYSFSIALDYDDPEDTLSNFVLELTDQSDHTKTATFDLEKTKDEQVLSGLNEMEEPVLDIRHSTFDAVLTYLNLDEEETFTTTLNFNNNNTMESKINAINIPETANYTDYSFEVSLDYVDDFDIIDDISLLLEDSSGHSVLYPLEKTKEPQTIITKNEDNVVELNVRTSAFTYVLTYYIDGNPIQLRSEEAFSFADNSSYKGSFKDVFIDPYAYFTTNTFSLTLDYDDEFDELSNFEITLLSDYEKPNEYASYFNPTTPTTIPLTKTTDPQLICVNEYSIYLSLGNFAYTLTYERNGSKIIADQGNITFEMKEDSTFNSFNSDFLFYNTMSRYEIEYNVIALKLDYVDEGNIYEGFYVRINETNSYINKTDRWQFVTFETEVDLTEETDIQIYGYVLDYRTHETSEQLLYSTRNSFTLSSTPKVYDTTLSEGGFSSEYPFVTFTPVFFDDDHLYHYSIIFKTQDNESYPFEMNLEDINTLLESVTIQLAPEGSTSELIEAIKTGPVNIYLSYYENADDPPTELLLYENYQFEVY